MEHYPEGLSTTEKSFIIISDEESDTNIVGIENSTSGVNTPTHTRRNSTEELYHNSLSVINKEKNAHFQIAVTSHIEGVDTSSHVQRENSVNAFTMRENSIKEKRFHLRSSRTSLTCEDCGKHFKSLPLKERHISVSKICRKSNECQMICPSCKKTFPWEQMKVEHMRFSNECNKFLKERFLNKEFVDNVKIYDDYYLNKSMCPFCLFTDDNGDVFNHVLNGSDCRKKFEAAVLKYSRQNSPANVCESEQPQQHLCNICNSNFSSFRDLRTHKLKKHEFLNNNKRKRENNSNYLYCLSCKKYLKSKNEIENHCCKPTRLLSRYCYSNAVWREGEYECRLCNKFFLSKTPLEKHMYFHEKKRSTLFKFVPSASKQNELPLVQTSGIINGSAAKECKLCQVSIVDINNSSTVRNLNVELKDWSKTSEDNVRRKIFMCRMCKKKFNLPEVFISHVIMRFPCLKHYENIKNNSPEDLNYCFKCKQKFRNNETFMNHKCLGLVIQLFQCALCPWSSPNITNLRNHEKSKHKKYMQADTLEDKQDFSDNNHDDTTTYWCSPCQETFVNLGKFLYHKSQFHKIATAGSRFVSFT